MVKLAEASLNVKLFFGGRGVVNCKTIHRFELFLRWIVVLEINFQFVAISDTSPKSNKIELIIILKLELLLIWMTCVFNTKYKIPEHNKYSKDKLPINNSIWKLLIQELDVNSGL